MIMEKKIFFFFFGKHYTGMMGYIISFWFRMVACPSLKYCFVDGSPNV